MNFTTTPLKKWIYAALFLAMGILIPQIFHMMGGPTMGGIFLPMHLSVLLGGMILGPFFGLILGFATPVLSFFLTGMPPLPRLPFMTVELIVYGLVAGIFIYKKYSSYLSLIVAQIIGRCVNALSLFILTSLFVMQVPAPITVWTAFVTGIPGVILQLLLIPPMYKILRKVYENDGTTFVRNKIKP